MDDRLERGVAEQGLEHLILVGIDGSLHHGLAKPPGRVDQDDSVKARLGVDGEHHAGAGEV